LRLGRDQLYWERLTRRRCREFRGFVACGGYLVLEAANETDIPT
jgi:hypothetical protein